jgi:hypothetical protein
MTIPQGYKLVVMIRIISPSTGPIRLHLMMASSNLYCWFCEEQTKGKSAVIADSSTISMIKAGKCCHLTCNVPNLENSLYLRVHPEKDTHDIKPFRIHCVTCNNQLGVMIRTSDGLRPSFQQHSVIFKDEKGKSTPVQQWKNDYARTNLIVPIENLGSTPSRSVDDAKFYVLDHKVWEKNKQTPLRVQKDVNAEEPFIFKLCLSENGHHYNVSAPSADLLPGVTTNSRSKVAAMEKDHDQDLAREIHKMNIVETVQKSWKDVRPVNKKFGTSKPVSIQSSLANTNPFSLLIE